MTEGDIIKFDDVAGDVRLSNQVFVDIGKSLYQQIYPHRSDYLRLRQLMVEEAWIGTHTKYPEKAAVCLRIKERTVTKSQDNGEFWI